MLKSKIGQSVPNVTFPVINNGEWAHISTSELFKGKTVIVFSLPGAFTPTCSSTHVPGYDALSSSFKDNGVDDIICMSVNDTFIMNSWKENQKAENITFIPDGNGEFTDGMGMLVDKSELGFGKRSWRYSMLVVDGIVEKMFIEPEVEGDPFEVSDAETMLKAINPDQPIVNATIFTKEGCLHCQRAKELLTEAGIKYEEVTLSPSSAIKTVKSMTGLSTVPQVYIDGKHIGGADELESHFS